MCDPINRNIGNHLEIINVLKTWQVIDGCKSNNELQCIEWINLFIEYSSSFFKLLKITQVFSFKASSILFKDSSKTGFLWREGGGVVYL